MADFLSAAYMRVFLARKLALPRREGPQGGLCWRPPTKHAICRILHHPAYAGAFVILSVALALLVINSAGYGGISGFGRTSAGLVNLVQGRSALQIFGNPDCMKFHSSMTLFSRTASDTAVFREALEKYFDGKPDAATLEKLAAA